MGKKCHNAGGKLAVKSANPGDLLVATARGAFPSQPDDECPMFSSRRILAGGLPIRASAPVPVQVTTTNLHDHPDRWRILFVVGAGFFWLIPQIDPK